MLGASCYSLPRPCWLSSRLSYVWGLFIPGKYLLFAVYAPPLASLHLNPGIIGRVMGVTQVRENRELTAFLVALLPVQNLLFWTKDLFVPAWWRCLCISEPH
jgi:hypothetical protein